MPCPQLTRVDIEHTLKLKPHTNLCQNDYQQSFFVAPIRHIPSVEDFRLETDVRTVTSDMDANNRHETLRDS
jgi:hypothetical protein